MKTLLLAAMLTLMATTVLADGYQYGYQSNQTYNPMAQAQEYSDRANREIYQQQELSIQRQQLDAQRAQAQAYQDQIQRNQSYGYGR
jgi:hypothetical protein